MPSVVSVFGVEPFRIGGTETFARELSLQLGRHGRRSVLCFLTPPTEEVRAFLDLPNVSLEVLGDSVNPSLGAALGLARILRAHRPDILHLHFTSFLGIYPWLGKLHSVRRIFFTDHSSRPTGYVAARAPFWKRRLVRAINLPVSKVICVSGYGQRCMTALDVLPAASYELVYNGVDLSRVARDPARAAEFRRTHAIPDGRALVVQVSWIIPEKGIPDLLEAARLVVAENPNVQFVFVGEGPYRERYMREAAAGLGDHVTWTGLVSDPFGEGVYEAADVVCQVSRWEEVFGWMIAEAMAHCKPVVATRVGGIPELIEDGVNGFLAGRGDAGLLAGKLLALLDDPALRCRMGRAGREVVEAKFDLRRNVTRLLGVYGIESRPSG